MPPGDDLPPPPPPPSRATLWAFHAAFLAIVVALTLAERAAIEGIADLGFQVDPSWMGAFGFPNYLATYRLANRLFRRSGRPRGDAGRPLVLKLKPGVFLVQVAVLIAPIGLFKGHPGPRWSGLLPVAATLLGCGVGLCLLDRRRERPRGRRGPGPAGVI